MFLTDKMQESLNKHMNCEMYASYLYLGMSAYFSANHLDGFAKWLRIQFMEEQNHAMKFYDYILERGGHIKLLPLEAPPFQWNSSLAAFEDAYGHEQKTTRQIYDVLEMAIATKDYATQNFLQWFVKEQVEEEATANSIVEKLKMLQGAADGVFLMDQSLGQRSQKPDEE